MLKKYCMAIVVLFAFCMLSACNSVGTVVVPPVNGTGLANITFTKVLDGYTESVGVSIINTVDGSTVYSTKMRQGDSIVASLPVTDALHQYTVNVANGIANPFTGEYYKASSPETLSIIQNQATILDIALEPTLLPLHTLTVTLSGLQGSDTVTANLSDTDSTYAYVESAIPNGNGVIAYKIESGLEMAASFTASGAGYVQNPINYYGIVNANTSFNATFSTTPPPSGTGNANITLPTVLSAYTKPIAVLVKNTANGDIVSMQSMKQGGNMTVSNLPITDGLHRYVVELANGIADPVLGKYYKVTGVASLTILQGQTTNFTVPLELSTTPVSNLNITVSGLQGTDKVNSQISDVGSKYAYVQPTIANGNGTIVYKIENGLNMKVVLTANGSTEYEQNPISYNGVVNTTTNFNATFSTTPPPPVETKYLNVGYFDAFGIGGLAAVPNDAFAKFDMLVMGFATSCNPNACGAPNPELISAATRIAPLMKNGATFLLSIGGQNDSGPFIDLTMTDVQATIYAQNLKSYITQINNNITSGVKITGVDLDIEAWNSGGVITPLTKALKEQGLIVAIAPILASVKNTPATLSLTGGGMAYSDYSGALANGYVDYLLIQAYNGGSAGVIAIDGVDMGSPSFHDRIAQAMSNLVVTTSCLPKTGDYYANGSIVCIPKSANTRIIIGTVANKIAGGDWTMWLNEDKTPAGNQIILNQFTASVLKAKGYPNYNGVMVWSLNNDWLPTAWGDTWDPAGAFTNNMVNFKF
jgi:chitinase